MKILGIDFGLKRVGLALTDPMGTMAFPLKTITRTTRDALFAELLDILDKEQVEAIVVGLPIDLNGEETLITRQARNFAASLGRRTDIPITMMDERLSSAAARDDLREAGIKNAKKRKALLDQQAAVHIVETYLNQQGTK